jgi:tRNA wybutosine-synthesizing protein 3
MKFEEAKERQLNKSDKSSIGMIDKKIVALCNKLNRKKNYYTTSSCAGRIILLKGEIDKQKNVFLFRTHEKISFKELKKALQEVGNSYSGLVEFKQSPCILHVACKTLDDAQGLVDKAKLAGWKHSGIMSTRKRYMVELHSTEHMDLPIMDKGRVFVEDDFLRVVIEQANLRLERVWEKIKRLKERI